MPPLSDITTLGKWSIECSLPRRETTISGIIRRVPLDISDDAILTQIKQKLSHLKSVSRLTRKDPDDNSTLIPTGSVRLDFDCSTSSTLPDKVLIYFQSFPCDLFVKTPFRCTLCQHFGHTKSRCHSKKLTCPKCSGPHSIDDFNSSQLLCPNCKGNHLAYSKDCPFFLRARHIETISTQHQLSYSQAARFINKNVSSPATSTQQPPLFSAIPTTVHPPMPKVYVSQGQPHSSSAPHTGNPILPHPGSFHQTPASTTVTPPSNAVSSIFLADICPATILQKFVLDIHNLLQKKLKDAKLKSALLQLINNFYSPRQRHSSVSSISTQASLSSPTKRKNKKKKTI